MLDRARRWYRRQAAYAAARRWAGHAGGYGEPLHPAQRRR